MKKGPPESSASPAFGKGGTARWILLSLGLALGILLVSFFIFSPDFSGRIPPLPSEIKSGKPSLRSVLESADAQARSTPFRAENAGRLAMAYHANQFFEQAEALYLLAAECAPGDYRWPYGLALLKEETGREKEVTSWLDRTVSLQPRYYPALQKLAEIYYKQERLEEAERYYRQSAEAGGRESACQAFAGLARIEARRNNWSRVVDYLAGPSRDNPRIRTLHQLLQEAYSALGQKEKAAEESRLLEEPTLIVLPLIRDPLGEELLGYSCSATRLLKEAGLKSRFRQPDEAIRLARRAVEVEPTDADARHFLARTLLEAHGGEPVAVEEALGHLREGLRLRTDDRLPLWYFAFAFFEQEKTDASVEKLRLLLEAAAGDPEASYYLGLVSDRQGNRAEALIRYQEAIRRNPQNAEARHKLGLLLVTRGRLDLAVREFEEAVRLKPMFALARCNLGIALEQQGKTAQAIAQFEEAIRSKPNDALSHQYLGIALLKSGKNEAAIRRFRDAVRFAPNDAEAHYSLGVALMVQKQMEEAAAEFRRALELQPEHPEAGRRLRELGR